LQSTAPHFQNTPTAKNAKHKTFFSGSNASTAHEKNSATLKKLSFSTFLAKKIFILLYPLKIKKHSPRRGLCK